MGVEGLHILVTGGAGFIGSRLAALLLLNGCRVSIIDDLSNGFESNVPERARFLRGDITNPDDLGNLDWAGLDAVCHLAAQSSGALSFADPEADMRGHVHGTFLLLERCRLHGVKRFLYASSSTIYGHPQTLPVAETHPTAPSMYYSAGKEAAEGYVRFFGRMGVTGTILRMPNVYGPGQNLENLMQGMVSIYLSYLLKDQPILVKGSLERVRDFIHVDDVARAWLLALKREQTATETYNLGSGMGSSIANLLDVLRTAWGAPAHPLEMGDGTPGDQRAMILDVTKIHSDLDFAPHYDLTAGIADVVEKERKKANAQ